MVGPYRSSVGGRTLILHPFHQMESSGWRNECPMLTSGSSLQRSPDCYRSTYRCYIASARPPTISLNPPRFSCAQNLHRNRKCSGRLDRGWFAGELPPPFRPDGFESRRRFGAFPLNIGLCPCPLRHHARDPRAPIFSNRLNPFGETGTRSFGYRASFAPMNPIGFRPLRFDAISGIWPFAIACDIAGRMTAWRR